MEFSFETRASLRKKLELVSTARLLVAVSQFRRMS
jgi:hypothetical protein